MFTKRAGIFVCIAAWTCLLAACALCRADDDVPPGDTGEKTDLARILVDPAAVPVTRPKGQKPKKPPAPNLPAEWSVIVDRRCRLVRDAESGWCRLEFEPDGQAPAELRWAMPCRRLEKLEQLAATDSDIVFRISGRSTVHKNLAYLLVDKATIENTGEELSAAPPEVPSQNSPTTTSVAVEPGNMATSAAVEAMPDPPARHDPAGVSAAELIKAMASDKPGRPVLVPSKPKGDVVVERPVAAPVRSPAEPTEPGGMVIDRLIVIAREPTSRWWQARFLSDNTLREPPVRLLPGRLLQRGQATPGVVFRISGELTQYKRRHYLLPQKLLHVKDLGQF